MRIGCAAGSALQPDEYEPGIRACLEAGKSCTGYAIVARRMKRDRIGNCWAELTSAPASASAS